MAVRTVLAATLAASLAGCTTADVLLPQTAAAPESRPGEAVNAAIARNTPVDGLIAKYADHYDVPETLVRRVVKRESNFRPEARNGPYYGLMQILPATARTMGHRGPASELLDAETNLKYAVKYLRGAYMVADGNHDRAVRLYAAGYYYDAKRKGLLAETGLKPGSSAPETMIARGLTSGGPVAAFSGSSPSAVPLPSLQPRP